MNIEIVDATLTEKTAAANLLELYQYDFTEFVDQDVGEDGRFGADFLERYFQGDDTRHALLVRIDGKWAGLTFLHRGAFLLDDQEMMDVVEFFVMRKYRRHGVGARVARTIFERFPGRWEVRIDKNNTPAQSFWRRTIGECTSGHFEERAWDDEKWRGPVIFFDNGPAGSGR